MKKKTIGIIVLAFSVLVMLCFSGCGKAETGTTLVTITPSPAQSVSSEQLTGSWYGYWFVSDTTRDWESLEGESWDCCAQVLDEDNEPCLLVWDEDMPRDNYLAELLLEKSSDAYICTGGDFLDVAVTPADISLQLLDRDGPLLQITGRCVDSVTGNFSYTIYLRPWGDTWPDSGHRPAYYESWYLPLIAAGESVPDSIEADS